MKTKLLAISLLLFTSQVFSNEVKIIKEYKTLNQNHGVSATTYNVICIDNYKYLNSYSMHNTRDLDIEVDESTIQMFEERDGKSLPVRCN
tara:strand:+ start:223 stop:492 length:270 start_codon:yes stop_codon:yes gene_type:complete